MKDSGRRWLIAAVGLFVFLLVGWVLLALQLNSALAGPLPFGPGLMSKLSADYRADEAGRSVALIALSILEPAMQALGLTEDEAAAAHESLELAMSQPVPTATAMDFDGAAPFTATPTITNTSLPTQAPTATAGNTRRPPTRTPVPTKTDTAVPAPTDTPSGPTATLGAPTATSAGDSVPPVVDASGALFSPPPGDIWTCALTVSNVHLTDDSSGIDASQSGIKYDPGSGYIFLRGMTLVSGTSLDGRYSGTFTLVGFTVSYVPGAKFARLLATDQDLDIYVFAEDNNGNFAYDPSDFDYKVYVSCP